MVLEMFLITDDGSFSFPAEDVVLIYASRVEDERARITVQLQSGKRYHVSEKIYWPNDTEIPPIVVQSIKRWVDKVNEDASEEYQVITIPISQSNDERLSWYHHLRSRLNNWLRRVFRLQDHNRNVPSSQSSE